MRQILGGQRFLSLFFLSELTMVVDCTEQSAVSKHERKS